jgi:hypothetical protein
MSNERLSRRVDALEKRLAKSERRYVSEFELQQRIELLERTAQHHIALIEVLVKHVQKTAKTG